MKLTVEKLFAMFGNEDLTPVAIAVTSKGVKATRDDVVISAKSLDERIATQAGDYYLTLKSEGAFEVVKVPKDAAKRRQSPAFDTL